MIKEIKLDKVNNKVTAIIEDRDTDLIPLTNLTDLEEKIVATIWWSGVEGVKNIYLVPHESLYSYIYRGNYGAQNLPSIPFGETVLNVPPQTHLSINAMQTSNEVNWANKTENATLTLLDDSCITFDAIVIRANAFAWQVMLAADALTILTLTS